MCDICPISAQLLFLACGHEYVGPAKKSGILKPGIAAAFWLITKMMIMAAAIGKDEHWRSFLIGRDTA
jgi:hypothetical protein